MRKDLPLLDVSDVDPDALRAFSENENIIEELNSIPDDLITEYQLEQLRQAVRRRPSLIRAMSKKKRA